MDSGIPFEAVKRLDNLVDVKLQQGDFRRPEKSAVDRPNPMERLPEFNRDIKIKPRLMGMSGQKEQLSNSDGCYLRVLNKSFIDINWS
jgi:hypothetical protein